VDSSRCRLTIKELAFELNHGRGYVHAMKAAGFRMPGGMATVAEAREWLAANPSFSWRSVYVTRKFTEKRDSVPLRVI
jgi:hypothetical protein